MYQRKEMIDPVRLGVNADRQTKQGPRTTYNV